MPTPQNYRIGALTFYGVAVAPLGHLSTGEAFIGRDAAPITWGVGRPPWGAPTVIVGSKFKPGVLPQKWGVVDFMKCSHNELVDVIARWDGWVDPRWLGNAAAAPAAQSSPVTPSLLHADLQPGDAFVYADRVLNVSFYKYGGPTHPPGSDWHVSRSAPSRRPVVLIPRWDGYIRVAPTYSLDNVKWDVTPPPPARPMNPWPHSCDKCGAPALRMFTSIECSKSCAPDRRAR